MTNAKTKYAIAKRLIFFIFAFSFLTPLALLEASDSNQNLENIYYKVQDVKNDGDPSNVQYAIFKEESDHYKILKRGNISPGQKLPVNCFVCVDEDSDFVLSLYYPHVMSVDGKVEVKDFIKPEWKTLEKNALLNPGDEIKTSSDSFCEIQIGKSAVKFYPDTRITLISMNSDEVMIYLKNGKIFSMVEGFGGNAVFGIQTPRASFLAKGTSFLVDSNGPSLSVYHGKVEEKVLSSNQKFEVPQGKRSSFSQGESIKQTDFPKESSEASQMANFEKSAKQNLSQPENKKWIVPKTIEISGVTQDIIASYLDPSAGKEKKHPVIMTTTTVTGGVVAVKMLFHSKQVGETKLIKAGETAIADFVCNGGLVEMSRATTGKNDAKGQPSRINDQSLSSI